MEQMEQNDNLHHYKEIVTFAEKEITRIHDFYKFTAKVLGIIITVGLGIGAFLFTNSMQELKVSMKDKMECLSKQAESRIDQQFNEKNIRLLVEQKAKERVDITAEGLIKESIEKKVSPTIKKSEENLSRIQEMLSKTSISVKEIRELSKFMSTVISAQNDDRYAFDKISNWPEDSPFHKQAQDATVQIRANFGDPSQVIYMAASFKDGVDPDKLPYTRIVDQYERAPRFGRPGILAYLAERDDFPKKEKLSFFIKVLTDDPSLTATYLAGNHFKKETKQEWNPFVVTTLIDWWEKNKEEY